MSPGLFVGSDIYLRASVSTETTRGGSDYRQQGDYLSVHPLGLTWFLLLYLDGVWLYYLIHDQLRLMLHFLTMLFLLFLLIFSNIHIPLPLFHFWQIKHTDRNTNSDYCWYNTKTNCNTEYVSTRRASLGPKTPPLSSLPRRTLCTIRQEHPQEFIPFLLR